MLPEGCAIELPPVLGRPASSHGKINVFQHPHLNCVLAAWTWQGARELKCWFFRGWRCFVQSAHKGTEIVQQMLEEELERLAQYCDEEAQAAEALRLELIYERARRQSAWRLCQRCVAENLHGQMLAQADTPQAEGRSQPVQANDHGASWLSTSSTSAVNNHCAPWASSSSAAWGQEAAAEASCLSMPNCNAPDFLLLVEVCLILFEHAVATSYDNLESAFQDWCNINGQMSRKDFANLVVDIFGAGTGLAPAPCGSAPEELAKIVGVIWPLLDLAGGGAIQQADFLQMSQHRWIASCTDENSAGGMFSPLVI